MSHRPHPWVRYVDVWELDSHTPGEPVKDFIVDCKETERIVSVETITGTFGQVITRVWIVDEGVKS